MTFDSVATFRLHKTTDGLKEGKKWTLDKTEQDNVMIVPKLNAAM